MSQQNRTTNKYRFQTGDTPSEQDFVDLIDSYDNLNDAINDIKNISSLDDYKIMIE